MYSARIVVFKQAKLVYALRLLHRLTHLRISINSDVRYSSHSAMIKSDEFMRTAHGSSFDFDGTAASCIPLLPALRCLFLETRGTLRTITESGRFVQYSGKREDWHTLRGWRVAELRTGEAGDGGEPGLVELADDVMEATIRREELVLSDDEQVSMAGLCCRLLRLNTACVNIGTTIRSRRPQRVMSEH